MTDVTNQLDARVQAPPENETNIIGLRNLVGDEAAKPAKGPVPVLVSTSILAQDVPSLRSSEALPDSIKMNWSRLASSEIGNKLYDKLVRFSNRPDGWRGSGSKRLSGNALSIFLDFWLQLKDGAVEPNVALTSSGGIHAQWYKSPREYLDLTFQPDEKIYFALFDKEAVYEGVSYLQNVIDLMAVVSKKPLGWKQNV